MKKNKEKQRNIQTNKEKLMENKIRFFVVQKSIFVFHIYSNHINFNIHQALQAMFESQIGTVQDKLE